MINQQIMVYSVPRTGSTLIWQCLKKIFKQVLKSHKDNVWSSSSHVKIVTRKNEVVLDYSCPCVITERDPIDTFLSQWRNTSWQMQARFDEWIGLAYGDAPLLSPLSSRWKEKEFKGWTRKNDESQVFNVEKFKEVCDAKTETSYKRHKFKPVANETFKSIRQVMVTFRQQLTSLEEVKKEYAGPILVLQYERFWDDYEYIFSELEKFFDITISEEIKTEIKNTTSRKANIIAQEQLKGFNQINSDHIHGGHIFLAEPEWSTKVLGEKNLARIQALLACDFEEIMNIDLGE